MEKEALLEVRSLSVRYPGNKKEVLHQVDLTLAPGAITCVIGESGSGKSTLLQAVLQLPGKVEITGGDISFAGRGCRRCRRQSGASFAAAVWVLYFRSRVRH